MKKLLLLGALLAGGAFCLQDVSIGHGGTYRGPGDTVPPGGGGGGGGGGPTTPGPSGPGTPGPAGPTSPGPATPGAPGGAPGAAPATPTTGAPGSSGPDLTVWDFWWAFNREPYLDLKSQIHDGGILTGSDDFFLGRGEKNQAKDSLRPSQQVIREKVVPALKHALETERQNDILTGALIALAKIGDVVTEDGKSEFEGIIKELLKDSSQEVAETAAIALGILANDKSVEILTQLTRDDQVARSFLGKTEVPYRTRAFAAYGLGLLGYRTSNNVLRQDIAETLVDLLNAPSFSTRDIKVAAMIAFGLTPVDLDPATLEEGEEESNRRHVISREAQLDFLRNYFDPAQERENKSTRHWFVRSHAPASMARLLEGIEGDGREKVARLLLESVDKNSKAEVEIQMSCALALGQIGNASSDGGKGLDDDIRAELIRLIKDGQPQVRRFALISLAQSGGTPGEGEQALVGTEISRKELVKQMSRGKTQLKPWAALGVGVLARQLTDQGQAFDDDSMRALASEADKCIRPAEIGAYLVGLGIAGYSEAKELCLEKMEYFTGSDEARGYAAVALGLMNERSAIEPIQEIIRKSKYRPELLKQAAIALGLLGDKQIVPDLIRMLEKATGLATQAALSTALGAIGDSRSIDPLVEMLGDEQITATARGFAAVALGIVCDKEPLPWNSKISTGINYRANTVTLTGQGGTGILDIL